MRVGRKVPEKGGFYGQKLVLYKLLCITVGKSLCDANVHALFFYSWSISASEYCFQTHHHNKRIIHLSFSSLKAALRAKQSPANQDAKWKQKRRFSLSSHNQHYRNSHRNKKSTPRDSPSGKTVRNKVKRTNSTTLAMKNTFTLKTSAAHLNCTVIFVW